MIISSAQQYYRMHSYSKSQPFSFYSQPNYLLNLWSPENQLKITDKDFALKKTTRSIRSVLSLQYAHYFAKKTTKPNPKCQLKKQNKTFFREVVTSLGHLPSSEIGVPKPRKTYGYF